MADLPQFKMQGLGCRSVAEHMLNMPKTLDSIPATNYIYL